MPSVVSNISDIYPHNTRTRSSFTSDVFPSRERRQISFDKSRLHRHAAQCAPLGRMHLRGTKGLRAFLIAISSGRRAPSYRSLARAPLCASRPRKRPLLNLYRGRLSPKNLSYRGVRISCARAQSLGGRRPEWGNTPDN